MKTHFLRLLAYDHAAAQRQLAMVEEHLSTEEALLKLLSHIMAAQQAWLYRLKGESTEGLDIWKTQTIEALVQWEHILHSAWSDYCSQATDSEWDRMVTYTNYSGQAFTNTVSDILTHVFNHSTYHRAQINTLIRQAGCTPPSIDFIGFARGLF